MEDRVVLVGAGGHCKAIIDILGEYSYYIVGILDSDEGRTDDVCSIPVVGTDADALSLLGGGVACAIISVAGSCSLRKRLTEEYEAMGFCIPTIMSSRAYLSSGAKIGEGCAVFPQASIGPDVVLGNHVTVNVSAVISHGVKIGRYSNIAPNATLLGSVKVGEECLIGAGSVVLPGVVIGDRCTVGAGSVVLHDVPAGAVVAGNPAKPIVRSGERHA